LTPDLQNKYTKGSNERKGTKNYGLGIRMINWQTGQNLFSQRLVEHHPTHVKKRRRHYNALSNKFTRKTYDVRKLAVLFETIPSKDE
jgi:hypothetical protein